MPAGRKPNNHFQNKYIAGEDVDSWVGCGRERPGFQPAAPAPPRLSLPPTPQKSVLKNIWRRSRTDLCWI